MTAAEIYQLYEFSKAWRFGLLFAVNGAVFAALCFAVPAEAGRWPHLLAHLAAAAWSIGFTLAMRRDAHGFCKKLREDAETVEGLKPRVYGPSAQRFLKRITALLVGGWTAVAACGFWRLIAG